MVIRVRLASLSTLCFRLLHQPGFRSVGGELLEEVAGFGSGNVFEDRHHSP
jgi:hypothetical protein